MGNKVQTGPQYTGDTETAATAYHFSIEKESFYILDLDIDYVDGFDINNIIEDKKYEVRINVRGLVKIDTYNIKKVDNVTLYQFELPKYDDKKKFIGTYRIFIDGEMLKASPYKESYEKKSGTKLTGGRRRYKKSRSIKKRRVTRKRRVYL